jgi:NAD(P)-dependent dehydrogenase (short-subunit alcohol dehydrogenase family)
MSTVTPLAGQVAFVTGAAGGLGSAIARRLAADGAAIVATDIADDRAQDRLSEGLRRIQLAITDAGGICLAAGTSVTDAAGVRQIVSDSAERLGPITIAVTTAGNANVGELLDTAAQDWQSLFGVHLHGTLNVLDAVMPMMARGRYGRIITVTSGTGLSRAAADMPIYGSVKRAIASLTWELAAVLPPGLSLNALSPVAATPMIQSVRAARESLGGAQASAFGPSGLPSPDRIAPLVAHMCRESSGWLNGQVLFSNGSEVSVISQSELVEVVGFGLDQESGRHIDAERLAILATAHAQQSATGVKLARLTALKD